MDEKTNRVNVAQFAHINMMYVSELSEFSVGQQKKKKKKNQLVTEKKPGNTKLFRSRLYQSSLHKQFDTF